MTVEATALILPSVDTSFVVDQVMLEPLRPNEVLVSLKATSLCHTDISVQRGDIPQAFPVVVGHEGRPLSMQRSISSCSYVADQ
jgi:aryl-alcohol dehydrogenase